MAFYHTYNKFQNPRFGLYDVSSIQLCDSIFCYILLTDSLIVSKLAFLLFFEHTKIILFSENLHLRFLWLECSSPVYYTLCFLFYFGFKHHLLRETTLFEVSPLSLFTSLLCFIFLYNTCHFLNYIAYLFDYCPFLPIHCMPLEVRILSLLTSVFPASRIVSDTQQAFNKYLLNGCWIMTNFQELRD